MAELSDRELDRGLAAGPHAVALETGRSHVRYKVLALGVVMAIITYFDRVCISTAAPAIMADLHLNKTQMGFVFSAFTLAYALFEIPTGAWGDRVGTRRVLARIVAWWSTFTILTAAAFNWTSMLVTRFLFGAGEAGAWPNMTRTFSRWFPVSERGRAQGVMFMGAHLGGAVTPLLVAAMLRVLTWRQVFVVFGAIGFVWALVWYAWFRDDPAEHPEVGPDELKAIQAGRAPEAEHRLDAETWRRVLSSRSLLALCLMYFTQAFGFYFYITWLPTYLEHQRGFTGLWLGVSAGLPLGFSVLADLCGGLTTDWVSRHYGLRIGRCLVGGLALAVAGLAILAGATTRNPVAAALLIGLAGGASNFLLGACWGVCIDVAGRHAGLISACMNSTGQLGGALSPVLLPMVLGRSSDWTPALYVIGAVYLSGVAFWWFVDPTRPLFSDEADDPTEASG